MASKGIPSDGLYLFAGHNGVCEEPVVAVTSVKIVGAINETVEITRSWTQRRSASSGDMTAFDSEDANSGLSRLRNGRKPMAESNEIPAVRVAAFKVFRGPDAIAVRFELMTAPGTTESVTIALTPTGAQELAKQLAQEPTAGTTGTTPDSSRQ